jgi:cytoskeletal protein RodZ
MMETAAQNLGKQLRTKREHLGFTLQDVAQHTRIRKTYLESMEKGQLEDLPGQAYVTGFVRVYASHLGLDSNLLLALLDGPQEVESLPSPDSVSEAPPKAKQQSRPAADKGWGAFVLGFIVVITLGGLLYFLPSFLASDAPVETSVEDVVKVQDAVIPDPPVVVDVKEPDTAPASVSPLESKPVPVEAVVEASEDAKKPLQDSLPAIPLSGSTLRMLALTESSLIIYVDERKPQEYKLYNGLDLTWKIKKKVRVEMAEPGVAHFWLGLQELPIENLDSFQLQQATGD